MLVTSTFTYDSRVQREATTLALAGYEVHVLATHERGEPPSFEVTDDGVQVHRTFPNTFGLLDRIRGRPKTLEPGRPRPRGTGVPRSLMRNPRWWERTAGSALTVLAHLMKAGRRYLTTRAFARTAIELDADVYHAHDADTLHAAAHAARRRRARLVYDTHEYAIGRAGASTMQRWFARAVERRHAPDADLVITVSPSIAQRLSADLGLSAVTVLRNVPSQSRHDQQPRQLRMELGLPDDATLLMYLGGLQRGRGLVQVTRALAHLPTSYHLAMVGPDGGATADVIETAYLAGVRDRVWMLPAVGTSEILTTAAAADVGLCLIEDICLSYRYSLPNKLFEYVAAGVPIAASDLPDITNLVAAYDVGRVCDPTDERDIARVIRAIVADGHRHREAARRAAAELTWERESSALIDSYHRLSPPHEPAAEPAFERRDGCGSA